MKIPNKQDLQQIVFNHSSNIDYKDLNLYKICTEKQYSFWVIDTTFASDTPVRFRKNLLERIYRPIMTIDDKIRDEKLQYDIKREAAKISYLLSVKVDIYEYFTGKEILPSDQIRMIEQVNFTYFSLDEALENQTKKQVHVLKSLNLSNKKDELKQTGSIFPKYQLNDLITDKLNEIMQLENNIKLDEQNI